MTRRFRYERLLELAKEGDDRAFFDEVATVLHTLPRAWKLKMLPWFHGVIGHMMIDIERCVEAVDEGISLTPKQEAALKRVGVNIMNVGKLTKAVADAKERMDALETTLENQGRWGSELCTLLRDVLPKEIAKSVHEPGEPTVIEEPEQMPEEQPDMIPAEDADPGLPPLEPGEEAGESTEPDKDAESG